MLVSLHIENIAVIEKTDITFTEGFNVLTGETGAGKSIIIDAISAIIGERTSHDLIRTGEDNASVSAGNERAQVYMSAGYLDSEGIVDQSNYQRLTTRLKAEYQAKMEAEKAAAAAKAKAEQSEESNDDNIDSDSELEGHKATFAVADEEEQTNKSE